MKPVIAVIGAGFGDEGKGLATDYFAKKYTLNGDAPLVVRGNGGAQAGHTVVSGEHRHVFGHVGSGTFAGSDTFLSSNFIVNPLALEKELKALPKKPALVYASPDCRVTTVYDMAINSLLEISRGTRRHGSCGMGINETVTRHAAGYYLTLSDVLNSSTERLTLLLADLLHNWVAPRLVNLGLDKFNFDSECEIYFNALQANDKTARALKDATSRLCMQDSKRLSNKDQEIIYEGAQGLALDEFLGTFPHVTRSVTGLPSAIRAAAECGRTEVQPVYMTRCYKTRHGAGVLLHEGESFGGNVVDVTNVDNPWQGSIRYAPLDIGPLRHFIQADLRRSIGVSQAFGVKILKPQFAVTCLDQVQSVQYYDMKYRSVDPTKFTSALAKSLGIEPAFESWGPSAKDVKAL